jgi:hypothetical protein
VYAYPEGSVQFLQQNKVIHDPLLSVGQQHQPGVAVLQANPDVYSDRLRKDFLDDFSFGDQPIVNVIAVLATTLFVYRVSA